jgi:hypothetical protein
VKEKFLTPSMQVKYTSASGKLPIYYCAGDYVLKMLARTEEHLVERQDASGCDCLVSKCMLLKTRPVGRRIT